MQQYFKSKIHGTSITRCGAIKVVKLLTSLGICGCWSSLDWMYIGKDDKFYATQAAYDWLNSWISEIDIEIGLSFPSDLIVSISHHFEADSLNKKFIRPMRDPRDSTISNYDRLVRRFYNPDVFTEQVFLDSPLVPSQGGILGLGMLEEIFIQEYLLNAYKNKDLRFNLYFDKIENKDVNHIKELLTFFSVQRSEKIITEALENCQSKHYGTTVVLDKWKKGECPYINERYNLLSQIIDFPHSYEKISMPIFKMKSGFDDEHINTLEELWVQSKINMLHMIFCDEGVSVARDALKALISNLGNLPLLKYELCELALVNALDIDSALKNLYLLSESNSSFVKLRSEFLLASIKDSKSNWLAKFKQTFHSLRPENGKERHFKQLVELAKMPFDDIYT